MKYISTRNSAAEVSAAQAIAKGISEDGGLFVPSELPKLSPEDFKRISQLNYEGRAAYILKYFLTDFTETEISECVKGAYRETFDNNNPAPVVTLPDGLNVLELWHGPTCAFKDLALQLLPFLLTASVKKTAGDKRTVILVATSGDTGKAALEGFCDVDNTNIIVFYPSDGVSAMQKLQMSSQNGGNVYVCAIHGNFDDAQSGVKAIFTDDKIKLLLLGNGMLFSSANSINWGRLVPQIVYYISAWCDLREKNPEAVRDGFNIVVPTGNFGNILAAYYAKKMGVPVNRLICASNANNVLTDFIRTGIYDRNREFHTTISPSMDILISSNLERLLFDLCGSSQTVADLQSQLSSSGKFEVDKSIKEKIKGLFYGGFCDDAGTLETISDYYSRYHYLCDTHTAVALNVYGQYKRDTGDTRPALVASTASPYKFAASVIGAVSDEKGTDGFETAELLSKLTDTKIPTPIAALKTAAVRFTDICEKQDMANMVLDYLKISK